jgi:chitinase
MKCFLLVILPFLSPVARAQHKNQFKLIAYYTGNADSVSKYPLQRITHLIYSFVQFQNDTLGCFNEDQCRNLQKLVLLKKDHPKLKIMVSIGGWGGCASCSDLFATDESRIAFARNAVSFLKQNGVDGLDIDWEYPALEGFPGHKYDTADRTHFTALVKALRKEMGNHFLLSFAAGGFVSCLENSYDWKALVPLVDFVNLMTYDLVGGYSTVTGHHTPLKDCRPGEESAEKCTAWLLNKKVPARKLVIGAACYARVWENVPDTAHGLYQPGKFLRGVSYKDFPGYFSDSSGFRYYWDNKAKAPWQYNASKKLFASFDDDHSIREKTRFVVQKKLGGIMFWQLVDDRSSGGMVDALWKGLGK